MSTVHDASAVRAAADPRVPRTPDATTSLLAAGAVAAVTLNLTVLAGITTGVVVGLALLPIWWSVLPRYVGAKTLVVVAAGAVAAGLWLAAYASASHDVAPALVRATTFLVLGGFCGVGVLLWARTVLSLRQVGLAAAAGLVLQVVLDPPDPVNPWKFGLGYAVSVTALALAVRGRPRWLELLVLLGLAATSALNDSRSAFAILLLAAVLHLWQLRPATLGRRASGWATLGLLGAVAGCVYVAGTAVILEGYLGQATQQRSLEQIRTSGSILLGGRPEWGATLALVEHRPWGYGAGVQANLEDISVAKTGMAELNYDPNNGYVENFMFGAEIKLHAVVADFWSNFGVAGVVLAALVTGLVAWSLATLVAQRRAHGLALYLACTTGWNLLFGPLYTSMPALVLTLGLLLVHRAEGADNPRALPDRSPVPAA